MLEKDIHFLPNKKSKKAAVACFALVAWVEPCQSDVCHRSTQTHAQTHTFPSLHQGLNTVCLATAVMSYHQKMCE